MSTEYKLNYVDSPYFVYGTLKPEEIAFYQIKELVEKIKPAVLKDYALYVRDGIPVIFQAHNNNVDGFLLWSKKLEADEFARRIKSYEGERLYALKEVEVIYESNKINSLTHVGKNPLGSYAEPLDKPWSSASDPIFSKSFPSLFSQIKKVVKNNFSPGPEIDDWNYYNDITSKYLLLITIVERLAFLYCGDTFTSAKEKENGKIDYNDRIMKRITTLGTSEQFLDAFRTIESKGLISNIKVFDSRDARKSLSTKKPKEALEAWYQVRSNLQHRGKSAMQDVEKVQGSLIGLANVMSVLLPKFIPLLENTNTYKQLNL